jgi:hypothetical protein
MAAYPGSGAISYNQKIKMNNPDHDTLKQTDDYGKLRLYLEYESSVPPGTPGYTWLQVVHFK